jgi:hypothetical protein
MKQIDWSKVEEAKEFAKLKPGGYVCRITHVQDNPDNEYLLVEYDIAQGEFKDHFKELYAAKGFWGGRFVKSYKEKAQPFFKAFITAVQNSNSGFVFDNDEKKLVGKFIGLVLGEEGYIGNDGGPKDRLYVKEIRSVDAIKSGDFKVPEYKPYSKPIPNIAAPEPSLSDANDGFMPIPEIDGEEMPFN